MGETEDIQDLERIPFYLKRRGEFDEALREYALHFANAHKNGNIFVSETCFDQIFDIQLLLYVKHRKHFSNVRQMRHQLEKDVHEVVSTDYELPPPVYKQLFESCWRRHSPRGRGQTPFSVDRQALIPSLRYREQRTHE